MRIVCQQTILIKYHALFVTFEKKEQNLKLKLSSAALWCLSTCHAELRYTKTVDQDQATFEDANKLAESTMF